MNDEIKTLCRQKAEEGDSGFAIAYALLEVAEQQAAIAVHLKYLGTGDAGTTMGAIEYLGVQVEKAGQTMARAMLERGSAPSPHRPSSDI